MSSTFKSSLVSLAKDKSYESPALPWLDGDLTNPIPSIGINSAAIPTAELIIDSAVGLSGSYPFDITINTGAGTCTFIYGTINGVAPTNISSALAISTSGTAYVYLQCSATNGVFTSSTIATSLTAPSPISNNIGYPPNSFVVPIHVVVNGVPFRIINKTSLQAISKEVFRIQKTITTPDMLPYDSYYTWSISDV